MRDSHFHQHSTMCGQLKIKIILDHYYLKLVNFAKNGAKYFGANGFIYLQANYECARNVFALSSNLKVNVMLFMKTIIVAICTYI